MTRSRKGPITAGADNRIGQSGLACFRLSVGREVRNCDEDKRKSSEDWVLPSLQFRQSRHIVSVEQDNHDKKQRLAAVFNKPENIATEWLSMDGVCNITLSTMKIILRNLIVRIQ